MTYVIFSCYYADMKIIRDRRLINRYVGENDFYSLFDHDISNTVELLYFESGEYLILQGTASRYLLFLVDGSCIFFTIAANGNYISYGTAKSFQVIGEVSSLWDLSPNNAVQAIGPAYCLGIDLYKYRETLLNDNRFLRYICRLLSDRVIYSNRSLASYVGALAENRLAAFILQNSSDSLFEVRLTRCSEAIGISYRHLLRLMDSFCQRKIIRKEKRRYYIISYPKLKQLSSYVPDPLSDHLSR